MKIKFELYKPSGKWYMDEEIEVPPFIKRSDLHSYLIQLVYQKDEMGWIICVHPDIQPTKEAKDFIVFPELIK